MTTYYRIADWDRHYEVDDRSHIWKPGKPFRLGSLEYLRIKARRDWNHRLLAMKELGDEVDELLWAAALGIFERLCLMVACEPRELRAGGIIRYSNGQPATIEQMARMFRYKVQTMQKILGLLLDPEVQWIEAVCEHVPGDCLLPEPSQDSGSLTRNPGNSEESGDSPGSPETPGVPEDPGDSGRLREMRLKSRTRQENTIQSQEEEPQESTETGLARDDWVGVCKEAPPEPKPDSQTSQDIYSLSGFDHVRLGFLRELRSTLGCDNNASHTAIINFERWVHEELVGSRATRQERSAKLGIVMGIARDCRKAITPAAAFMQRVKDELGYIPPTAGKLRERRA